MPGKSGKSALVAKLAYMALCLAATSLAAWEVFNSYHHDLDTARGRVKSKTFLVSEWIAGVSREAGPDHDFLRQWLKTIDSAPGEIIAIADFELTLVARKPATPGMIGKRALDPLVAEFVKADSTEFHSQNVSPFDNIERLNHFRKVNGMPYLVVAAEGVDGILAGWRRKLWIYSSGLLVVYALGYSALHHFLRIDRLRRELAAQNAELKEGRDTYQTLFENNADGAMIITDGEVSECNDAAAKMLGYADKSELLSHTLEDFSPPTQADGQDSKAKANSILALAAKQGAHRFEWLHRRVDGKELWVEVMLTLMPLGGGKTFHALMRDIGEKKRFQEALMDSEKRFRSLFNHIPNVAIQGISTSGEIIYWNKASEQLYGYTTDEAVGKQLVDLLVPPERQQEMRKLVREMAASGKEEPPFEIELLTKEGGKTWVRSHSAVVESSSLVREIFSLDISLDKRKAVEDDLRRAKEQAEKASLAKSHFLANISHEVRTPLSGVIGMAGIMLDSELSDEQKNYVEIIHSSGESLLALINSIVDMSKIDSAEMEFDDSAFDPRDLLGEAMQVFRNAAEVKNIGFSSDIDIDPGLALVGDPGRLRQVLMILVDNAVKFTSEGGVEIKVRVEPSEGEVVKLDCRVVDTGIGIAEENLDALFQPFQQLDASSTRQYGGTGLGLALCARLVKAMGGEIGLESVKGEGSMFRFSIPFKKWRT